MRPSLIARLVLLGLLAIPAVTAAQAHPVSMWVIEGLHNRVYLLGSVHLLRKDDHPLPAVIEAAYREAEALVMELDLDDIDPFAHQGMTNRLGMLEDGRTLEDVLGETRYARAAAAAAALDVPLDMLEGVEPWFAAVTVEQLMLLRMGFNPLYGIEMYMASKAGKDDKPISGLETLDEQLGFLDGLSPDAQADLLLQTLAESRDLQHYMDRLVTAWRYGDTVYMENFLLNEMQQNEELYEAIVVARNRAWIDDIEALLDEGDDYLVVVGALHMVGDDGVPRLLEQRGIAVEQVHEAGQP